MIYTLFPSLLLSPTFVGAHLVIYKASARRWSSFDTWTRFSSPPSSKIHTRTFVYDICDLLETIICRVLPLSYTRWLCVSSLGASSNHGRDRSNLKQVPWPYPLITQKVCPSNKVSLALNRTCPIIMETLDQTGLELKRYVSCPSTVPDKRQKLTNYLPSRYFNKLTSASTIPIVRSRWSRPPSSPRSVSRTSPSARVQYSVITPKNTAPRTTGMALMTQCHNRKAWESAHPSQPTIHGLQRPAPATPMLQMTRIMTWVRPRSCRRQRHQLSV